MKHDRQRCVVPECKSTRQEKHHVFPKDEKQGLLWLTAVCNPMLNDLTYSEIYKKRYRVCHLHFRPEDFISGPRNLFVKKAVPSLLLPMRDSNNDRVMEIDVPINLEMESEQCFYTQDKQKKLEYSPVSYRNCVPTTPESDTSVRKSSLLVLNETVSTPKLKSTSIEKRKLDFEFEQNDQDVSKSSNYRSGEVQHLGQVSDDTNTIHNAVDIGNGKQLIEHECTSEAKEKCPSPSSSSKNIVRKRASKRLVWKHKEMDEKSKELYHEVLSARKELDNYKTKSKRYLFSHFYHCSKFETKYTKAKKHI